MDDNRSEIVWKVLRRDAICSTSSASARKSTAHLAEVYIPFSKTERRECFDVASPGRMHFKDVHNHLNCTGMSDMNRAYREGGSDVIGFVAIRKTRENLCPPNPQKNDPKPSESVAAVGIQSRIENCNFSWLDYS